MEPSLRSSAPKGIDCKLRKPDPSLHETTQRFVESQLGDIRISQYADMNYASAIMKSGKWMFLDQLDGGRVGFLVMTPKSPIVWMDDRGKSSFIIPMRIQTNLCEKGSIAVASLNKSEGILRIEDMKILGGEDIRGLSFTRRWERLLEFYRNSYVYDSTLQRDLRIQPAVYKSIDSIQTWGDSPPDAIFAQNDTMPRRLRIQIKETGLDLSKNLLAETRPVGNKPTAIVRPGLSAYTPVTTLAHGQGPSPRKPIVTKPIAPKPVTPGPGPVSRKPEVRPVKPEAKPVKPEAKPVKPEAKPVKPEANPVKPEAKQKTIAVPSDEFPDTYTIIINGEKKGYAAVQDIELSKVLRLKTKETKEIPVKIEWNPEFASYEILSLL